MNQETSLSKKAQELKELLDEQKKLDTIPLPDRTKVKDDPEKSYGE